MKEPIVMEDANPDAGDICFCGICVDWFAAANNNKPDPLTLAADDDIDPVDLLAAPLDTAVFA